MMWLVRTALRRPLTVAVMAALMLVLGILSFSQMNVDIFPAIKLPVVMVVWNYPGLPAVQMERRMVWISERAYSTTVNGIDHIDSQSINGLGILKVYFHPGSDLGSAIAQMNAVSQTILSILPRGTQPPQIISYDASNLPVAQLNMFSDTLSEQQLFDYGLNFVRIQLFTIPGFSTPAPLGGVQRSIMVNLDPKKLYALGLSPQDVGQALANSNVVIPSGTAKMGNYEYNVDLNMSPDTVANFNTLPIKTVGTTPVLLGEVAPVSDTHQPQTNVVRVDGRRGAYLMVIKHADASTLAVVHAVRDRIPRILASLPTRMSGLKLSLTLDQSKFVSGALWEVVRESGIAALLVSLMVLLFLGSARSMLVVIASIPLSILTAIVGLRLSDQTINTMTLGGIALAVGMLVDDATVAIENIHRNHAMGKPLLKAILDGSAEIATPTLIGTLSICIVFFPVVLLTGVAKFLFTPLALAVVYAMLTSYLLSRTLVPAMASYLLPEGQEEHRSGFWAGVTSGFERGFERAREMYTRLLTKFVAGRKIGIAGAALLVLISFGLVKVVGEDFFPTVDAGMMRLHVRAPTGTRLERTEQIVDDVERTIRDTLPSAELETISDNIGLPVSYDLAFYQTDTIGPMDADILIQLKEKHRPTSSYEREIRSVLQRQYPSLISYFQPADLVGQVLNFGLPAAIDVEISGSDLAGDYDLASRLRSEMEKIPGVNDLRIAQPLDYPAFQVDVDRAKASEFGISEQQVASSMLTALNGNSLLQPNFWLDPRSGVNYSVISQAPQHSIASVQELATLPVTNGAANNTATPQLLANLVQIRHSVDPAVINHFTLQRVIDVNASVRGGSDLGSVSDAVQQIIKRMGALPRGVEITIRGQSQAMRESFGTLELGIVLAAILVYLLMVANFQSWLEPLIIMMAVPGALAGALWMMAFTHTTINVESLMGMIMAVGVGVANANLLIIFANERREEGMDSTQAAIEAGRVRLRPIIMTALAMILGMLPMAIGFGSGSELNAPLGRAVIGGLVAATFMTLFVVPALYSMLTRNLTTNRQRDARLEQAESQ